MKYFASGVTKKNIIIKKQDSLIIIVYYQLRPALSFTYVASLWDYPNKNYPLGMLMLIINQMWATIHPKPFSSICVKE